ncbi:putative aconitate mitochondrial [Brachionus plicatilis]|uniref:Putative aconitate mitochondrial n=1 Tax=Brachionus plicatilis TaxID=10195 RepID=A0A3M7R2D8_BRAPC|nr:putative aconitate mitochondrial [Brachionus plicatilis]
MKKNLTSLTLVVSSLKLEDDEFKKLDFNLICLLSTFFGLTLTEKNNLSLKAWFSQFRYFWLDFLGETDKKKICLTLTDLSLTFNLTPIICCQASLSKFEPNSHVPYEKLSATLRVVKSRLNRPLTLSEKILYSHLSDPEC